MLCGSNAVICLKHCVLGIVLMPGRLPFLFFAAMQSFASLERDCRWGHVKTINQILLAEDNPGDVELVREALREHDVHCELRIISDG
jgi:hypothetical protein